MSKKVMLMGLITILLITGCSSKGDKGKDKDKDKEKGPTVIVTEAASPTPTTAEGTPSEAPGPSAAPTSVPSPMPTPDISNVPEGYYVKWLVAEETNGRDKVHSVYDYDKWGRTISVVRDSETNGTYRTDMEYRLDGERLIEEVIYHGDKYDTVEQSVYQGGNLVELVCMERREGLEDKVIRHQVVTYDPQGRKVKDTFMENGELKSMDVYWYEGDKLVRKDMHNMRGNGNYLLYKYDDKGNVIREEMWIETTSGWIFSVTESEYCDFGPVWTKFLYENGEEEHHEYKYDKDGNCIWESRLQPGSSEPFYYNYEYNNGHKVHQKQDANGYINDCYWNYDGDLLVKEYELNAEGKESSSVVYTYDEYGNLIKEEHVDPWNGEWTSTWTYRPIILPENQNQEQGPEEEHVEVPRSFYEIIRQFNDYVPKRADEIVDAPNEPPVMGEWRATRYMFVTGMVDPYVYFVKKAGKPTHYATMVVRDGIVSTGIYLNEGWGKYTLDKKAEYSIADDVEIILFTKLKLGNGDVLEVVQYEVNDDWETFNKMYSNPDLAEIWVEDGKIVRVLFRQ